MTSSDARLETISAALDLLNEAVQMLRTVIGSRLPPPEPLNIDVTFLDRSISEVDFGGGYNGRARSLEIAGKPIRTIRDLVLVTEEEALRNYNCGRKTVNRIKEVLAEHGLRFGMILE